MKRDVRSENEQWSWSGDSDPQIATAVGDTRSNLRVRFRRLAPELVAWVGTLVFVVTCMYGITKWILR